MVHCETTSEENDQSLETLKDVINGSKKIIRLKGNLKIGKNQADTVDMAKQGKNTLVQQSSGSSFMKHIRKSQESSTHSDAFNNGV